MVRIFSSLYEMFEAKSNLRIKQTEQYFCLPVPWFIFAGLTSYTQDTGIFFLITVENSKTILFKVKLICYGLSGLMQSCKMCFLLASIVLCLALLCSYCADAIQSFKI